ncbi:hypothetical protein D3C76_1336250 [compost metagenome]
MTAAQKDFQAHAAGDERRKQLAHQLRFAQAIGLQGKFIRLGAPLLQLLGILPAPQHAILQGPWQPLALHLLARLTQVGINALTVVTVFDELRVQPAQMCQQQRVCRARAVAGEVLLVKATTQKAVQALVMGDLGVVYQVIDGDETHRRRAVIADRR